MGFPWDHQHPAEVLWSPGQLQGQSRRKPRALPGCQPLAGTQAWARWGREGGSLLVWPWTEGWEGARSPGSRGQGSLARAHPQKVLALPHFERPHSDVDVKALMLRQ